jgi:hypothetical protein
MDDFKRSEFQDKVRKLLSGEDSSSKRQRHPENISTMGDIKGICSYLNTI